MSFGVQFIRYFVCGLLNVSYSWQINWLSKVNNVPRAASIPADQNISPQRAGINNNPPILSPNWCWSGSSIVIYPAFLMGEAKSTPPIIT